MGAVTRWHAREDVEGGKIELSVDRRGRGPRPGEVFCNPNLERVLRSIGKRGARDGFYRGFSGKAIVRAVCRHG